MALSLIEAPVIIRQLKLPTLEVNIFLNRLISRRPLRRSRLSAQTKSKRCPLVLDVGSSQCFLERPPKPTLEPSVIILTLFLSCRVQLLAKTQLQLAQPPPWQLATNELLTCSETRQASLPTRPLFSITRSQSHSSRPLRNLIFASRTLTRCRSLRHRIRNFTERQQCTLPYLVEK